MNSDLDDISYQATPPRKSRPEPQGYVTLYWDVRAWEWKPVVPENAVKALGQPIKLVRITVEGK